MAKSEVEEVTRNALEGGGLLAHLYFDMQHESAEKLQPLLTELINEKLMKTPGVIYCFGSIEDPIKVSEHLYSTTSQVTVLFKDLGVFVNVIFNFAPAGIEILKPDKEYRIKVGELQSLLLQLSQVSMDYSKFIFEKVLKPEDFASLKSNIDMREQIGKKLLEKKKGEEKEE